MAKTKDPVQDDVAQKMQLKAFWLASLIALVLTACAPAINPATVPVSTTPVIQTQTVSREAQVHRVEIQITNSTPVEVNAVVRGT